MSELDNKKFPYNLTQTQYIENLERQLEEAREETTSLKSIIKDMIKSCRVHKLNRTADEIERQLKEKGDE